MFEICFGKPDSVTVCTLAKVGKGLFIEQVV